MRSPVRLVLAALLVVAALWVAACGKDKSTNPVGGGGGGAELNSGSIANGIAYQHTFATAGTFNYQCTIHPQMLGTVTVAAGGQDSALVTIINNTSTGFSPGTVTVKPGGFVRWTNTSGMTHNVTSR